MKPQYLYVFTVMSMMLLLASNSYAQSQESYIVTNRNDTLKCAIKRPLLFDDFGNGYKYRLTKKDSYKPLIADSIKAYYFAEDSITYFAEVLPGNKKPRFVTRLEHGKINVYQDKAQSSGRNTLNTWYASKLEGPLLEIKTEGLTIGASGNNRDDRKKNLSDLLADNPSLAEQFARKNDFGFKAIREAIQQYNVGVKQ